jgi:tetratricopeptide (TPR) repeat protein
MSNKDIYPDSPEGDSGTPPPVTGRQEGWNIPDEEQEKEPRRLLPRLQYRLRRRMRRSVEQVRTIVNPGAIRGRIFSRATVEDLAEELILLSPQNLEEVTPDEAPAIITNLRDQFENLLRGPEASQSEVIELQLILAGLFFLAGREHVGNNLARNGLARMENLRKAGQHKERLGPKKRLAWLYVFLAQHFQRTDRPRQSRTCALHAAANPCLDSWGWRKIQKLLPREEMTFSRSIRTMQALSEDEAADLRLLDDLERDQRKRVQGVKKENADEKKFRLLQSALMKGRTQWPVLELAELDIDAGRLDAAHQKLKATFDKLAEDMKPRGLFLLGQVCYGRGQFGEADDHFNQAGQAGVDLDPVCEPLGITKANLGMYDAAAMYLAKALDENPLDIYLLVQMANVHLCLGQRDQAETHFRKALQVDPNHVDALYGLARLLDMAGDSAGAEEAFDRLLAVDADNVAALFFRGILHLQKGKLAEARTAFDRVGELEPDHLPNRAELGILMINAALAGGRSQLETGIAHLQECRRRRHPDQRVTYWLGRGFFLNNQFDQCLELWEELLEAQPGLEMLRHQVGIVQFFQMVHGGLFEKNLAEVIVGLEEMDDSVRAACPVDQVLGQLYLDWARQALQKEELEDCRQRLDRSAELVPDLPDRALVEVALAWQEKKGLPLAAIQRELEALSAGEGRAVLEYLAWIGEVRLDSLQEAVPGYPGNLTRELPGFLRESRVLAAMHLVFGLLCKFGGSAQDAYEFAARASSKAATGPEFQVVPALQELLDLLGDLAVRRCFQEAQLGWWLGSILGSEGEPQEWLERVEKVAAGQDGLLWNTLRSLLAISAKDFDLLCRCLEEGEGSLPDPLRDYLVLALAELTQAEMASFKKGELGRMDTILRGTNLITELTGSVA